jgi:5-methyltetrahydrofolate--homocysteine methyltransferase
MNNILDHLHERVLLCDGGFGSQIQGMSLRVEEDYLGHENCTDVLVLSRPDLVRDIHARYFAAGADMVETNSFGASPLTLGEFGIADQAFAINRKAAELAREAAEQYAGDGRHRFVLGSVGPGTKLPSLGHVDYDTLERALVVQTDGLIAGGVDAILIETCQDPLQIKAAVNAAKIAAGKAGRATPIFVQVTVETTGTLLVGADIAAAATVIRALDVPLMGLNCATGPQEMSEHVRWLSANWPGLISIQPNAGLPELVDGQTAYPLRPEDLALWHERFLADDRANLLGGCCGTTPAHIAAVDAMLRRRSGGAGRPVPAKRQVHWVPALASLYSQVPLRQENAFLSIGERCNANGSKKFRECQEREDWDGTVAMGREQVREGSHTLDLCTAFVGRNEVRDMTEVLTRMRGAVNAPVVIDSTELPVIEAALKLYGGKAIINSINFENGEEPAAQRLALAKKFGAAVIALTIDENGMAKDAEAKVALAHRLYDFAVNQYGLDPADLLFDPLTFTICTGNEDDRKLAVHTLDAIERISRELPDCQVILGLSNVSFGLKTAARHVLNSVFLDHACRRGMTGAIVHVSKIAPLHTLAADEVRIAEDLIFDRRAPGYDPLSAFIALFEGRDGQAIAVKVRAETVEERLKQRIVDGDRTGLEDDLALALERWSPLDIVNQLLLDGMKVVGELFGAGKMQLPFVLQSAETMKASVAYLEQFMDKADGQQKGTIVLATVKGDVHDIGKNLVDIILTNNGYRVVNLGIKQPIAAIVAAAREHAADAIGMSGLLVKSTVVMRENLEELSRQQIDLPVLLGGAALTRAYVEDDCMAAYEAGRVAYARDAFDGLDLMAKAVDGRFDDHVAEARARRLHRPVNTRRTLGRATQPARPVDCEEIRLRRQDLTRQTAVPTPPFWGAKVIDHVPLQTLVTYLNETMLYQFQWGYKKAGRSLEDWRAWAARELKPMAVEMLKQCQREGILTPKAVYGYWRCAADGDAVVLFDEDGTTPLARFAFPRQSTEGGLCIADFVRDIADVRRDVIGLQVVTMGHAASDVARQWFAENRYKDYLHLHGLSVEMTEAMAEYVHARIRAELGFAAEDDRDVERMLRQGYRGSRYSFGYPACPQLEDQAQLLALLGAERIGVTLSEEWQLEPEQSTSAIVLLHPEAKYFSV